MAAANPQSSAAGADPTDVLLLFLQGAVAKGGAFEKPEYHAVFANGTVVRFQLSKEEFKGFHDEETYEFPEHRLKNPEEDLPAILNENQAAFQKLLEHKINDKEKTNDEQRHLPSASTQAADMSQDDYVQAVHTSYRTLIEDGYPYPGGEGADRNGMPLPGGRNRFMVVFPARNMYVYNVVAPSLLKNGESAVLTADQLITLGGDLRRDDFMLPRLVTIITPTLQVHRLPAA